MVRKANMIPRIISNQDKGARREPLDATSFLQEVAEGRGDPNAQVLLIPVEIVSHCLEPCVAFGMSSASWEHGIGTAWLFDASVLPLASRRNNVFDLQISQSMLRYPPNGRNSHPPNGRNSYPPNGRNSCPPNGRNSYPLVRSWPRVEMSVINEHEAPVLQTDLE
eukprot:6199677-Pleurochrysis_carterae.AAC.3